MHRTVVIGERSIVLDELGASLDQVIDRLHEAYFANLRMPWPDLTAPARAYFDAKPASWTAHNAYFHTFTLIWQDLLNARRYDNAEHVWSNALRPALQWEEDHPGSLLHKGTPYYFWGMTVLLKGDIDCGYLLMHQAVQEDVQTFGPAARDYPGYALISLNYERMEQAFRVWVQAQARLLGEFLDDYNAIHQRTLTPDDVKHRFLETPPTTETLFLLTYTLARFMNLTRLPDHTAKNPFAGQLQLNLLFDITLVVENTIKPKSHQPTFIRHAEFLLNAAGSPLTIPQLRDINQQFIADFDTTLAQALDGTLTVAPALLNRLQCDVALAYGLRNRGAHSTDTATTIWTRFTEVQVSLFRTLFATIDYLY